MAYSPSYYQPSILELARQGNFQAIAYWINSILGPQGIYIHASSMRPGCLRIDVTFQRHRSPQACIADRQRVVRHLCYRLWTLNCSSIREVRIVARQAGRRDILWRQTVRFSSSRDTHARPTARRGQASRRQPAGHQRFQLLRSFMVNRLALVGFIFCYWIIYLEATGHQGGEQPSLAATPPQEAVQTPSAQPTDPVKTAIAPAPPQNPVFTVPAQFQGQTIYEATPPAGVEKVVALTFDDGPWENTTEQVLNILQQNNIKGTFYFVGEAIQANPAIAKKVVDAGHAVGNHTWRHIMEDMDTATAAQELGNAARLLHDATGVRTYLMRPPGGNLTGELANYAKQQGYMVTMWSADSSDYYVSTPLIIDNVLSNVKPGGIVLLHDGGGDRSQTVEALPQIISSLQKQGYKFVTVPELMEKQARWAQMQPSPPPAATPTEPGIPADQPTPAVSPSPSSSPTPIDGSVPAVPESPGATLQPTSPTTPAASSTPEFSPQPSPTLQAVPGEPAVNSPQFGQSPAAENQGNAGPQPLQSPPGTPNSTQQLIPVPSSSPTPSVTSPQAEQPQTDSLQALQAHP